MGASHEGHPEVIRILVNEANVDVEAKNIVLPAGVPSRSHGEKDSCGMALGKEVGTWAQV